MSRRGFAGSNVAKGEVGRPRVGVGFVGPATRDVDGRPEFDDDVRLRPSARPDRHRRPPARHRGSRRPTADQHVYRRRRLAVCAAIAAGVGLIGWTLGTRGPNEQVAAVATPTLPPPPVTSVPVDGAAASADGPSLAEVACTVDDYQLSVGSEGASVECAQTALRAAGYDYVDVNSVFDGPTEVAVRAFQDKYGLYVDGLLGKRTAIELGIWPGDESFIVRTPVPESGAKDLWGMQLSSVASAGDAAPPLPDNAGQGTGKRVVYDRAGQRVWAIDDQERIVRSYLVSGSRFKNEVAGEHRVYSKSESALGWDLKADLPYMIRYTKTDLGNIGFHAIPSWRDSGEKLQTEDELGTKLSGGCTRQALLDAQFMWAFANVGTRVIVL